MILKGKVAIVTGASSGIGLATAKLLTQKGVKVALVARRADRLKHLSQKLPESLALTADMTKKTQIKRMVAQTAKYYGRVDILVNNAGIGYDAPLENIDIAKFRYLFELHAVGSLLAMQSVIPLMRKIGGGSIVNISSGTSLMYLPNMSAYSGIKRLLNALSLTSRQELQKDNIVVSVVYPFITLTDFEKNTLKDYPPKISDEEGEDRDLPPADPADYVATKILEAIITGKAEVYVHDWMKKLLERR